MAEFLNVPVHQVIKSIVFTDERSKGYMVLQHGDQSVEYQSFAQSI
ncbi:hypothetical protein OURE66S_00653 [Oligella ureolytica]